MILFNDGLSLWKDLTYSRYFLIPAITKLPVGNFVIQSLSGDERYVDLEAIALFEISKDKATMYIQAELSQTLEQVGSVFTSLVNLISPPDQGAHRARSGAKSNRSKLGVEQIANLLGISNEELRQNPSTGVAAIQKLADEFKSVLEDATTQDPTQQAAARERVNALQKTLQERGVEVGTTLEQLPELLQFVSQLGEEATVHKLAETLHSFTDQLDQSPEALGRKLDEFIASMEQNFGTFVGSDTARQQERIYQEAKASARSAIAESLRAQGITPLASPETETAKNKKSGHK